MLTLEELHHFVTGTIHNTGGFNSERRREADGNEQESLGGNHVESA